MTLFADLILLLSSLDAGFGMDFKNPEMMRTYQDHACIALTTGFMMGEGGGVQGQTRGWEEEAGYSAFAHRNESIEESIKRIR